MVLFLFRGPSTYEFLLCLLSSVHPNTWKLPCTRRRPVKLFIFKYRSFVGCYFRTSAQSSIRHSTAGPICRFLGTQAWDCNARFSYIWKRNLWAGQSLLTFLESHDWVILYTLIDLPTIKKSTLEWSLSSFLSTFVNKQMAFFVQNKKTKKNNFFKFFSV